MHFAPGVCEPCSPLQPLPPHLLRRDISQYIDHCKPHKSHSAAKDWTRQKGNKHWSIWRVWTINWLVKQMRLALITNVLQFILICQEASTTSHSHQTSSQFTSTISPDSGQLGRLPYGSCFGHDRAAKGEDWTKLQNSQIITNLCMFKHNNQSSKIKQAKKKGSCSMPSPSVSSLEPKRDWALRQLWAMPDKARAAKLGNEEAKVEVNHLLWGMQRPSRASRWCKGKVGCLL